MATPTNSKLQDRLLGIAQTIITASIMAAAGFIYTMKADTAVLLAKTEQLQAQTSRLDKKIGEIGSNYIRRDEFKTLEGRVSELEKRPTREAF